ncbi:hypothetical protein [Marinomonas sp. TW1]|uniref:hypothetical protein n=1 Tax=Marinomonas sp. TW1 TaxID=1561203 RepID=UPI0007AF55A1|nr:hypothetical protein [Marinomonas sp. TW1]KZN13046.1 hypothetical protein OA79_12905 [Marinomonas sp. TW1]
MCEEKHQEDPLNSQKPHLNRSSLKEEKRYLGEPKVPPLDLRHWRMDGANFKTIVEQAIINKRPIIFYVWFGPGSPTKDKWWEPQPQDCPYEQTKQEIGYSPDEQKHIKESAAFSAMRCGPCYQTIRNINCLERQNSGKFAIDEENNREQNLKPVIILVAWSSKRDEGTAIQVWEDTYDPLNKLTKATPWIWFGDILDAYIEWKEDIDSNQEIQKHLDRAAGGHHHSAIITGKEILALLLRSHFGGLTADTTVLPAIIGKDYDPGAYQKTGERHHYYFNDIGSGISDEGWTVMPLHASSEYAESKIIRDLNTLFSKPVSAGPTQNRNQGGVVYQGQPKDTSPNVGYRPTDDNHLVTYDYQTNDGRIGNDSLDPNWQNLDLLDVFLNYTPYANLEPVKTALSVFLEGTKALESGVYETLEVYNAYRGPATLSAAATECYLSASQPNPPTQDANWKNRTITKLGTTPKVTYISQESAIKGFYETRNPTPNQLKDGQNIRDVLGPEGYMLMKELSLVKLWSGGWKAPQNFAVPITPRKK